MDKGNWVLINKFLGYLQRVKHADPKTLSRYRSYLTLLLRWAGDTPFIQVQEIEPGFLPFLESRYSSRTKAPLARETWRKTLGLTSRLFNWLKEEDPKKYKGVSAEWIDSLVIPKSVRPSPRPEYVSLDSIHKIRQFGLENRSNLPLFRDAAAGIFLFLSGIRADAFVSLPIRAVDIARRSIQQHPALGVRTKFGKEGTTFLLEIPDLLDFIQMWDALIKQHLPPTAMWYPPLRNEWGEISLTTDEPGTRRGQTLNKRLRRLFSAVGLPYQSAHKFRHAHAHWGIEHCRSIGQFKVVSQNLMHESIAITDQIYASFTENDRRRVMRTLGNEA